MIRGKKNFLHPTRLEMGLTILFKIDESCVKNHLNDRKIKNIDNDDEFFEEEIKTKKENIEEKSEELTMIKLNNPPPKIAHKKNEKLEENKTEKSKEIVEKEIKEETVIYF